MWMQEDESNTHTADGGKAPAFTFENAEPKILKI